MLLFLRVKKSALKGLMTSQNTNFFCSFTLNRTLLLSVCMLLSTFYNKGVVLALMLGYEMYYYVCCTVIYYVILCTLCDILLGYDVLLSLDCP